MDGIVKLLMFDLDGTLLSSRREISPRTLAALQACRKLGVRTGVATSRNVQDIAALTDVLQPDVLIASGGALIRLRDGRTFAEEFSGEDTARIIGVIRRICGSECEISIGTQTAHYWNYKVDPASLDHSWGQYVYSDFEDFAEPALKICVEIADDAIARTLQEALPDGDWARFSDGNWYKLTRTGVTKESAIARACELCGVRLDETAAFGDDWPDIGMLRMCGVGVAMGNAIDAVKAAADLVIGSNDEDGIAVWLEERFLR